MKLRQLECLCAIVDAGFNISRAATNLHSSQPAVGKQLRQLEEEIGTDLLLRVKGRPTALTPTGERTIEWARRSLQCAKSFRETAREAKVGEFAWTIPLFASHTLAKYIVLPAISSFLDAFPNGHFKVMQGLPDQAAQLMQDGEAMFGVAHQPRELPPGLVAIPFRTLDLALLAPARHPLLRLKQLTLESIATYPLIAQNTSRPQGARVMRTFFEAGLDPKPVVEAPDAEVVKAFVTAGIGVAIIPAFTFDARRDTGLRIRDASNLFGASVAAIFLKRDAHLPAYAFQFLEMLDPTLERRRIEGMIFGP
ncbi:LysR substrate-binding domain-containing protein [Paraburkholderia sp. JHI869]|uniref:LysR substrate-binding domain-containing protein n=1 Tax=Paraburkholderia sp. JHI869 TaxID=3112959 RepID=UPI0031726967